ncbi:hypothetical protein ABT009_32685 [Streptomyces sp. NPDC002896]|uniref:hypothetical protein n=1 Tax=Streptomyces sp. NPDC002896 TaxID=3154438 RepID=UPI003331A137
MHKAGLGVISVNQLDALEKFDRGVPANADVLTAIEPELSPTEKRVAEYYRRVNDLKPQPIQKPNANAGTAMVEIFDCLN